MVVVPALTIVTVLPLTVATVVFELVKVTGVAGLVLLALRAKSASPKVFAGNVAKVITGAPACPTFSVR